MLTSCAADVQLTADSMAEREWREDTRKSRPRLVLWCHCVCCLCTAISLSAETCFCMCLLTQWSTCCCNLHYYQLNSCFWWNKCCKQKLSCILSKIQFFSVYNLYFYNTSKVGSYKIKFLKRLLLFWSLKEFFVERLASYHVNLSPELVRPVKWVRLYLVNWKKL